MADKKFVVKIDTTGEEEEFSFDDTEFNFDDVEMPEEEEDVHFNVNMEVTDPVAHLKNDIEIRLQIRKSFDESLMITDHENIDIVIVPSENKIVTFPKSAYDDISYRTQERFFERLADRGVINREDIEGGNIYGSLQCSYVDISNPNQSTLQMILFMIWKWMETEKPNFNFNKQLKGLCRQVNKRRGY